MIQTPFIYKSNDNGILQKFIEKLFIQIQMSL
jgi:hypothetical protein